MHFLIAPSKRVLLAIQVLVGLALLGSTGCRDDGPKLEPLSGKVLRDGKPLTNVSVTLVPEDSGMSATGQADSSGEINIQTNGRNGAIKGKYKVSISEPIREMTPEALKSGSPPPVSFDPKYTSPQTSGIEYEVPEGGSTFEFVVTNRK